MTKEIIAVGITIIAIALYELKLKNLITQLIGKYKHSFRIKKLMREEQLDFNKAQEMIITQKIAEVFNMDEVELTLNNITVNQGEKVSFMVEDNSFFSGEFVGIKRSQALGYTYNFFLKLQGDRIYSAPIETIIEDTFTSHGR